MQKKLAEFKFAISLHWIPSHIENTEYGKIPIEGNLRADNLAEIARLQEEDISSVSIDFVQDNLLDLSETLISKIHATPSSDDFSNSDAIRDLSRKRNSRDINYVQNKQTNIRRFT